MNTSSTRTVVASSRETLALATLLAVGSQTASAQAPATSAPPPVEGEGREGAEVLPETVVNSARETPYNPELLSTRKATAPLLDTPQTFSVIPEIVYKQQAAISLADVLKNTPGITYNAGENGFAAGPSNFNMRGFESSGNVFIDGVRDQGNYSRDIFNIEQVEVAKGPAADNGRGGAGGYVNLVTKTPRLIDAYAGTLSYGFDDSSADSRLRATLDLNHNLTRSPIPGTAIRLNGLYQSGGVAGRDYAERNSWGVAPSVAFGLGTPTRVIFAYQYLDLSDIPDLGVPGVLAPGIHAIHAASGLPFLPPADHIPRDIFYGRTSDFDDVSSHSFIARFEHDFASGATLTNQTRISDTNREALYTLPFGVSPLPAVGLPTLVDTRLQANDRQTQTYSNLTNFAMEFETGALKHSIATGLELSREEGSTGRVFTNLGGADLVDIANPDPSRPRPLPGPQSPGERDFVRIDTAAVYAYDTLELSRQWQLTGGFRLEHYDAEIKSTEAAYDTYRTDDTTLSGKLGLVYKPLEYGSIYASAGVSKQPPGGEFLSNPDGSRSATPIPGSSGQNARGSDTQESTNYELGTKWDLLDKRLSTTLAAFHTRRDNIAFGSEPDLSYGDQTVYGLEWGISGAITENWMIFGGAAYMESETRVGAGIDSTLALTPRWSGNLFTTYHFDKPGLTIGGGLQYVGSSAIGRPSNTFNGSPGATATAGELPSYLTFNALLAYELNQNVTLRLNVDNVFDEEYTTSANFPGTRAYLGAPRTFTISADWKF